MITFFFIFFISFFHLHLAGMEIDDQKQIQPNDITVPKSLVQINFPLVSEAQKSSFKINTGAANFNNVWYKIVLVDSVPCLVVGLNNNTAFSYNKHSISSLSSSIFSTPKGTLERFSLIGSCDNQLAAYLQKDNNSKNNKALVKPLQLAFGIISRQSNVSKLPFYPLDILHFYYSAGVNNQYGILFTRVNWFTKGSSTGNLEENYDPDTSMYTYANRFFGEAVFYKPSSNENSIILVQPATEKDALSANDDNKKIILFHRHGKIMYLNSFYTVLCLLKKANESTYAKDVPLFDELKIYAIINDSKSALVHTIANYKDANEKNTIPYAVLNTLFSYYYCIYYGNMKNEKLAKEHAKQGKYHFSFSIEDSICRKENEHYALYTLVKCTAFQKIKEKEVEDNYNGRSLYFNVQTTISLEDTTSLKILCNSKVFWIFHPHPYALETVVKSHFQSKNGSPVFENVFSTHNASLDLEKATISGNEHVIINVPFDAVIHEQMSVEDVFKNNFNDTASLIVNQESEELPKVTIDTSFDEIQSLPLRDVVKHMIVQYEDAQRKYQELLSLLNTLSPVEMQKQAANLKVSTQELSKKIDIMKEAVAKITGLEKAIENFKKQEQELQHKENGADAKYNTVKQHYTDLDATFASHMKKINDFNVTLNKEKTFLEECKKSLEHYKNELQNMCKQIASAVDKGKGDIAQTVAQVQKKIKEASDGVTQRCDILENDINTLKTSIKSFENSKVEMDKNIRNFPDNFSKIERVEKEIADAIKNIEMNQGSIDVLKKDIRVLRKTLYVSGGVITLLLIWNMFQQWRIQALPTL